VRYNIGGGYNPWLSPVQHHRGSGFLWYTRVQAPQGGALWLVGGRTAEGGAAGCQGQRGGHLCGLLQLAPLVDDQLRYTTVLYCHCHCHCVLMPVSLCQREGEGTIEFFFFFFPLLPFSPWIIRRCCGARVPYTSNMNPRFYGAFADYLTTVVARYPPPTPPGTSTSDSLEPFNEAREGPWFAGYSQEGCHMSHEDIAAIIPLVHNSLKQKGLKTRLVGIDSWADLTVTAFQALNNLTNSTPAANTTIRRPSNSTGTSTSSLSNSTINSTVPSNSASNSAASTGPRPLSLLTEYHIHAYVFPSIFTSPTPFACPVPGDLFRGCPESGPERGREMWMSEWCALWRIGSQLDLALLLARTVMESVKYPRGLSLGLLAGQYDHQQYCSSTVQFSSVL